MVKRPRFLRRLPVALLIALAVSVAVGGALAGTDTAEGRVGDSILSIPMPRLGDKGAYRLTMTGDWDRPDVASTGTGQAPYGQPWTAIEFEWREAGVGQDPSGARGPVDELAIVTREWGLDIFDDQQPWRLEDEGGAYTYRAGESVPYQRTFSQEEIEDKDLNGLEVPLVASNVGAGSTYRVDELRAIVPNCFLGAFQGEELDLEGVMAWPEDSCTKDFLPDSWYAVSYVPALHQGVTFRAAGQEAIAGYDAHRLESIGLPWATTLWLSEDVPYPLRFALESSSYAREGETAQIRLATFDLVGYEAGATERVSRGPWLGALPPVALAPRQPWMMDETGIVHPFPLSVAYTHALGTDGNTSAFLREHADAYMSSAGYGEHALYGQRQRLWVFTLTNGTVALRVEVSESLPDGLDLLPGVLRSQAATREVVSEVDDAPYPWPMPPGLVPAQVPTVAAVVERWRDFGGQGSANAWGFGFSCKWSFDCSERRMAFVAGESWSEVHTLDDGAAAKGQAPVRQSWLTHHDSAAVDEDGTLVRRTQYDRDWSGTYGLASPAPLTEAAPTVSRPVPSTWQPTATQAAGAGAVGLLAGLLYFLWPAIKAGPVALFSRIEGPKLLDHPVRARLSQLVAANPGIHFKELRRQSGLANGVIVHHLDKLAASNLVTVKVAGRYRCYFPPNTGAVDGRALAAVKADGAQKVIAAVRGHPGLNVQALAQGTGLGRSTVHYHLQRLQEAGLVRQGPGLASDVHGSTWMPVAA